MPEILGPLILLLHHSPVESVGVSCSVKDVWNCPGWSYGRWDHVHADGGGPTATLL